MKELLLSIVTKVNFPMLKAPYAETRSAEKADVRFSSRRRRRLTWIGQVCRNSR